MRDLSVDEAVVKAGPVLHALRRVAAARKLLHGGSYLDHEDFGQLDAIISSFGYSGAGLRSDEWKTTLEHGLFGPQF